MRSRELRAGLFLLAWVLAGAAVLITPLIVFTISRQQNSAQDYYQSLYERQQELYAKQQKAQQNAAKGGYGHDDYWTDDWTYRKKVNEETDNCSYLWGCGYKNHEDSANDDEVPNWWMGEKEGEANFVLEACVTVVYIFDFLFICGVLLRGIYVASYRPQALKSLFPLLLVSGIASMVVMMLVGFIPGMIAFEGASFEEHGWYGQVGILLFLTCFFWIFFTVGFSLVLYNETHRETKMCFDRVDGQDSLDTYTLQDDDDDMVPRATISSGKKQVVLKPVAGGGGSRSGQKQVLLQSVEGGKSSTTASQQSSKAPSQPAATASDAPQPPVRPFSSIKRPTGTFANSQRPKLLPPAKW